MSDKLIYPERAPLPARPKPGPPALLARPTWLDFFLILAGCALSLLLTDLSGFRARPTEATPNGALLLRRSLPYLLFLPAGVLLLFPLFYLTQRISGRKQALTVGEWLWFVAWLGALLLTTWVAWQHWGTPPEYLSKGHIWVGYAVSVLALAAVALITGLVDLIGRWGRPWTHHLALTLLMWPALPLLSLLAWGFKIG
jgi:hypothetical protein